MNKKAANTFAREFTLHTGIKTKAHKYYTDIVLVLDTYSLNVPQLKAISDYLGTVFHVEGQYNGVIKTVAMQPSPNSSGYCLGVRIDNRELERVFG